MICTCCETCLDTSRNHMWRVELSDVEPGCDKGYLMAAGVLCQNCAMNLLSAVKTGQLSEYGAKTFRIDVNRLKYTKGEINDEMS